MKNWIKKQINIIDFTLSFVLRRKGKNVALMTVYTTIVFALASVMFFTDSLRHEAASVLRNAPEIVVQRTMAGRHELIPESYAAKVSGISGVVWVQPRLWGYYFNSSVNANYTVMAPEGFGHEAGTIMIGNGIARIHRISKGSAMWFTKHDGSAANMLVAGVLPAESEIISSDMILMGRSDFMQLFGTPEAYATDLAVKVRNPRELTTIAAKIAAALPDSRPIIRDEILRTYEAVFNWRQGLMIAILLGAVLAFAILAWEKASGLSAEEKKEIGILKAVGWDTSEVIAVKSWEGFILSFSAFLMGILLAYIHVFFTSYVLFEPVLKGWSVLYPEFALTPYISPYEIFTLLFLTVAPYMAATIVPSWRAAIVDPDEVMRS